MIVVLGVAVVAGTLLFVWSLCRVAARPRRHVPTTWEELVQEHNERCAMTDEDAERIWKNIAAELRKDKDQ